MAEILLSLTIIGVVAAITLPSLTGNINERTWNTQRKALYARFSQALALMPSLSGYGTYDSTTDTAAETFVTEGLSKVLKINNICDHDHLDDCGIPTTVTAMNGEVINNFTTVYNRLSGLNSMFSAPYSETYNNSTYNYINPQKDIDPFAAAFETANGESILLFYNPFCQSNMNETSSFFAQTKMCANFVYDLNGNKGPNTVGKDIGFISALYPSDPVIVAPVTLLRNVSSSKKQSEAGAACSALDSESRLPNREELAAIFYNRQLIDEDALKYNHWSSSVYSVTHAWAVHLTSGSTGPDSREMSRAVRCVKR